jgi:hypothetical protein
MNEKIYMQTCRHTREKREGERGRERERVTERESERKRVKGEGVSFPEKNELTSSATGAPAVQPM